MNAANLSDGLPRPSTQEIREQLGVRSRFDDNGKESLSLQVESIDSDGPFGLKISEAIFDESTGRWKIIDDHPCRQHQVPVKTSSPEPEIPPRNKSWTEALPKKDLVDWFLSSADWSQTDLGPLESWPIYLRTVIGLVLADDNPAVIYWGPSRITCFNHRAHGDICRSLSKHTSIQALPFEEIYQQTWSSLQDFYNVMQQETRVLDDVEVMLFTQQQENEESIWSACLLPVLDENGNVAGHYVRATDITAERFRQRRAKTLYASSAPAPDPQMSAWEYVFQALSSNAVDFPMAFAYSAEDDGTTCTLTLEQTLGIGSAGHPLVPSKLDIFEGSTGLPFYYRTLRETHKPIVLHQADNTLPACFLEGFEWRGYGDVPVDVASCPSQSVADF